MKIKNEEQNAARVVVPADSSDSFTASAVTPNAAVYDGRRDGPVHGWFELSYAQYLTIPRSVLQSMPVGWQERFVECLEQLDAELPWRPEDGRYWVELRDGGGRKRTDPCRDYRHAPMWTSESLNKARGR